MNTLQSNNAGIDSNDEIDLLALIGTLIDYRWLIISVTGLFAVLGIVYALLATPIYQANAMIQIEEKTGGIAGLENMDDLFSSPSQAVTEIEILKSRMVVGRVVDTLQLDITAEPKHLPLIGTALARRFSPEQPGDTAAPRFGLAAYNWGGASIDIFQLDVPEALIDQPLTLKAGNNGHYTLFHESTELLQGRVGELATANGITLQVRELKATAGVEFNLVKSNRLRTIMDYQQSLQANERNKQSGMIGLSMQHPDPAFARRVLDEVARVYVRQNVERTSAEVANSLEFLREQLPQVRLEMEKAEERLNTYQISAKSANITIETQAVLNQLVDIEANLSGLKMKQLEMDKLFTREHPTYQTLLNQIASLESDKAQLEQKVSGLPEVQQELLRLTRDVQVSSEIYTQMLQKAQELDIARASTVGNVRVIDYAAVDTATPVAPKRKLIVIIATLLGGMLAVIIALIHNLLNRGVESPEEIEALDLPVYATIPFSEQQIETQKSSEHSNRPRSLLVTSHPADIAVESLRSLHTSLHFAMLEAPNNIIMLSGPSPKVGKSFVSANLATLMAQSGKKILLVDGDMRRGYLHKYFGNDNKSGLANLLAMQAEIADVLIHSNVANLDVITRGTIPPNPSELLLSQRFSELMNELSAKYDSIIIDTPPVLAVADALIVGKLAGTNFIIVRFGQNPAAEVRATVKRFESNGVTLKGAILNATRRKAMGQYKYGYDAYQYQYESEKS